MKNQKSMILLTTLVTLLPMAVGLLQWNRLPEQIPIHWNVEGQVDGWSGKAMAVFGMPAFMALMHLICTAVTGMDPKNKEQGGKTIHLVLWICPVVSVVVMTIVYCWAMGTQVKVELLLPVFMGLMFTMIGNYLPKCRQNYTIGIKVPWALNSEENWNATHRFAGKIMTVGGVLVMLTALTQNVLLMLGILLVMALVPVVYSYCYYRRHEQK